MMRIEQNARALACVASLAVAGCAGGSPASAPLPVQAVPQAPATLPARQTPIRHVVIIIQENRSFDNLFAGYPGADSQTFGYTHTGRRVALRAIGFSPAAGLDHLWQGGITDWRNGAMNGFDIPGNSKPPIPLYMYSYVKKKQVQPYWDMAQQYVLADHMFPTEFGPSFTAHQNLIAGSTEISSGKAVINLPTLNGFQEPGNCGAPAGTTTDLINTQRKILRHAGPRPCYSYPTMADALDAAQVSWKYYEAFWPGGHSTWDAFGAIKKVRYGPDWDQDVVQVPFQILPDATDGKLPAVSWVIPTPKDSDHPSYGSDRGPSWVAQVVNAIGNGPQWKSTAIIVVWDDWGGWYDNAKPPQLDYRGLGLRVPCIVISPYAKAGYVAHRQYEFGSILKTIEGIFGTGSVGTTDVRARGMFDAFDFSQQPRKFHTIAAKYAPNDFMSEVPSGPTIPDPGDD